jgi:hypothetical protein
MSEIPPMEIPPVVMDEVFDIFLSRGPELFTRFKTEVLRQASIMDNESYSVLMSYRDAVHKKFVFKKYDFENIYDDLLKQLFDLKQ